MFALEVFQSPCKHFLSSMSTLYESFNEINTTMSCERTKRNKSPFASRKSRQKRAFGRFQYKFLPPPASYALRDWSGTFDFDFTTALSSRLVIPASRFVRKSFTKRNNLFMKTLPEFKPLPALKLALFCWGKKMKKVHHTPPLLLFMKLLHHDEESIALLWKWWHNVEDACLWGHKRRRRLLKARVRWSIRVSRKSSEALFCINDTTWMNEPPTMFDKEFEWRREEVWCDCRAKGKEKCWQRLSGWLRWDREFDFYQSLERFNEAFSFFILTLLASVVHLIVIRMPRKVSNGKKSLNGMRLQSQIGDCDLIARLNKQKRTLSKRVFCVFLTQCPVHILLFNYSTFTVTVDHMKGYFRSFAASAKKGSYHSSFSLAFFSWSFRIQLRVNFFRVLCLSSPFHKKFH